MQWCAHIYYIRNFNLWFLFVDVLNKISTARMRYNNRFNISFVEVFIMCCLLIATKVHNHPELLGVRLIVKLFYYWQIKLRKIIITPVFKMLLVFMTILGNKQYWVISISLFLLFFSRSMCCRLWHSWCMHWRSMSLWRGLDRDSLWPTCLSSPLHRTWDL